MAEMWKSLGIPVYLGWTTKIIVELDLNDWEQEFVSGVFKRLRSGFDLTEFQAKKLEQIYVRTS